MEWYAAPLVGACVVFIYMVPVIWAPRHLTEHHIPLLMVSIRHCIYVRGLDWIPSHSPTRFPQPNTWKHSSHIECSNICLCANTTSCCWHSLYSEEEKNIQIDTKVKRKLQINFSNPGIWHVSSVPLMFFVNWSSSDSIMEVKPPPH